MSNVKVNVYDSKGNFKYQINTGDYVFNNFFVDSSPISFDKTIYPFFKINNTYYENDGHLWYLNIGVEVATLMPFTTAYVWNGNNYLQYFERVSQTKDNLGQRTYSDHYGKPIYCDIFMNKYRFGSDENHLDLRSFYQKRDSTAKNGQFIGEGPVWDGVEYKNNKYFGAIPHGKILIPVWTNENNTADDESEVWLTIKGTTVTINDVEYSLAPGCKVIIWRSHGRFSHMIDGIPWRKDKGLYEIIQDEVKKDSDNHPNTQYVSIPNGKTFVVPGILTYVSDPLFGKPESELYFYGWKFTCNWYEENTPSQSTSRPQAGRDAIAALFFNPRLYQEVIDITSSTNESICFSASGIKGWNGHSWGDPLTITNTSGEVFKDEYGYQYKKLRYTRFGSLEKRKHESKSKNAKLQYNTTDRNAASNTLYNARRKYVKNEWTNVNINYTAINNVQESSLAFQFLRYRPACFSNVYFDQSSSKYGESYEYGYLSGGLSENSIRPVAYNEDYKDKYPSSYLDVEWKLNQKDLPVGGFPSFSKSLIIDAPASGSTNKDTDWTVSLFTRNNKWEELKYDQYRRFSDNKEGCYARVRASLDSDTTYCYWVAIEIPENEPTIHE